MNTNRREFSAVITELLFAGDMLGVVNRVAPHSKETRCRVMTCILDAGASRRTWVSEAVELPSCGVLDSG